MSRDLTRPRDQRVMKLYRPEPIKVSYHPAMFGGHRHSYSRNIAALVCHVISQHHMTKGSYDCRQEPIKVSCNPAKSDGHMHGGSKYIMILVCHMIKG